ncbi:MAG: pilus (MSHA type) biogenesis protein MshL [Nitrospirae bacterium]|nr:pilus (MSHA type) biogenesis protein MshL [Nitrospirota bacterium]MBF0540286.1 pilus (MSHA type) biogenesis protein MshL [Nitrospirota bacterium]
MEINRNIIVCLMTFLLVLTLSCSKETQKDKTQREAQKEAQKEDKEVEKMLSIEDKKLSKTLYPQIVNQEKPKILEYEPVTEDISPLKNRTVTLSLRNSPLRDAVYILADIGNLNVVMEKGVDQKTPVTIVLSDVTLENALEMVFSSVDYFYSIEDNILKVKAMDTRIYEISIPPIIHSYSVDIGGDILGGAKSAANVQADMQGNIKIHGKTDITTSKLWESIGEGIKKLLTKKSTKTEKPKTQSVTQSPTTEGNPLTPGVTSNQAPPQTQTPQNVKKPEEKEDQTPEPSYSIDLLTGTIVVTASKNDLDKVERYINSIKRSLGRQVLIEAKIVEVQVSEGLNYGVNWNQLVTGTALGTYISGNNQSTSTTSSSVASSTPSAIASTITNGITLNASARFDTILDLLQTQGNVKTLSNPRITLLNGQTALLSVGTTESYISEITSTEDTVAHVITVTPKSQTILSGMMLGIAPYIDKDDNIILTITPVLSELLSFNQQTIGTTTLKLPNIALREMSTTVKLKDKQMVIIGGLISTKDSTIESGIPILSSIPILGNLFKSKDIIHQRIELVILIRPVLIL